MFTCKELICTMNRYAAYGTEGHAADQYYYKR